MITKKSIKILIEKALSNLRESENDLREAMSLLGDTGNRIALAGVQARLKQTIEATEDLIYEPEPETEAFRYTTSDGKSVVFSSANYE